MDTSLSSIESSGIRTCLKRFFRNEMCVIRLKVIRLKGFATLREFGLNAQRGNVPSGFERIVRFCLGPRSVV
jgi:hypothetical protein